jgi:hypothetical protein
LSPASAVVIQLTYQGTVSSGTDVTGVFGATGSLAGDAFSLVFRFDTTIGHFTQSATQSEVHGGNLDVPPSTAMPGSAWLTINGHTEAFLGNIGSRDYASFGWSSQQYLQDRFYPVGHEISAFVQMTIGSSNPLAIPVLITTPYSIASFSPPNSAGGYFDIHEYAGYTTTRSAYGGLTPTRLDVTDLSAVPLPAAWPMMLLGLAGIGGLVCRRSRKGFAAIAAA